MIRVCDSTQNMYMYDVNVHTYVSAYSLTHTFSLTHTTGVLDHRVLGNRSRAYLAMDRLDEALQDADTACQLRPFWPKVR